MPRSAPVTNASEPVGNAEFAALIDRVGPFEATPTIMVGVSGGPDSMALLHLMVEWSRTSGGTILAATVDHGLRLEAAAEAETVAGWCRAIGCEHIILRWDNPLPEDGAIQDRARQARYALLSDEARRRGILHLVVAHHADDQVETVLLRLGSGSGVDGLAGMPAISELEHVRLIRPLLTLPGGRLRATCSARGQTWIEDPSNRSSDYARVRMRRAVPALAEHGLSSEALLATRGRMASARRCLEEQTTDLLARAVALYPHGYGDISRSMLQGASREIGLRALGQMLRTIGDGIHPLRREKLEGLFAAMVDGAASSATLGGCLIERVEESLRVMPEGRFPPADIALDAGASGRWGAFNVTASRSVSISAAPADFDSELFPRILSAQPAFSDASGIVAIPTLGYFRDNGDREAFAAWFRPRRALAEGIFAIV